MADPRTLRFPVYVVGQGGRQAGTFIDYFRAILGGARHCLFIFSSLATVKLFFASHPAQCDGHWRGVATDAPGLLRVIEFIEKNHGSLDAVAVDIVLPPSGVTIETAPIDDFRAILLRSATQS